MLHPKAPEPLAPITCMLPLVNCADTCFVSFHREGAHCIRARLIGFPRLRSASIGATEGAGEGGVKGRDFSGLQFSLGYGRTGRMTCGAELANKRASSPDCRSRSRSENTSDGEPSMIACPSLSAMIRLAFSASSRTCVGNRGDPVLVGGACNN